MSISGFPGYTRPPVRIGTEMSKMRLTTGCEATVVRALRWETRRFARAENEARDRSLEGRSVLPEETVVPLHPSLSRLQNAETLVLVDGSRHDRWLLADNSLADDLGVYSIADGIMNEPPSRQQLRRQFADVLDAHEVREHVM